MPLILPARTLDSGFNIDNSLRFNDGDSPKVSRSISSSGSSRNATLSVWVKRGILGTRQQIYSNKTADSSFEAMNMYFNAANDRLYIDHNDGSANKSIYTNMRFRDVAAWYHIVHAIDTTTGTATNRLRVYVNGTEITSFALDQEPSQNADLRISDSTGDQSIGDDPRDSNDLFDGYMAEYNFVDGTTLDPTYFGEFNDNGVWIPKKPNVSSYGTNGFFLEFKQTGTSQNSSGMGADTSGNTNHFAVTNLTATDQTTDTPTNNFCTFNSVDCASNITLTEGNTVATANTNHSAVRATMGFRNGKWYWEQKVVNVSGQPAVGILGAEAPLGNQINAVPSRLYRASDGDSGAKYSDGSAANYGDEYVQNDIIGVAVDMDNGAIYFSKNGTFQDSGDPTSGSNKTNAAFTDLLTATSEHWLPAVKLYAEGMSINFGNPSHSISSGNSDGAGFGNFEYAVPSGYYALCTKNLAEYG